VRRSYKYRLYPNPTQAVELAQQLETLRRVYNDALAERKDAWELYGAGTNRGDQVKRWRTRRNLQIQAAEGPRFLARVGSEPLCGALNRLDKAFQNFFRRVKAGRLAGYPRFRGKGSFNSIPSDDYPGGCVLQNPTGRSVKSGDDFAPDAGKLLGYKLDVFGVGRVRVKMHRPVRGRIKTVTVKREADKWYVVFSCDLGDVEVPPHAGPAIGVDMGLAHFLTTSEGQHTPNPKFLGGELPELRRRQRAASRKYKRGKKTADQSKRWRKSLKRVAKLHARVKNLRKEHAYKVAHDLVKKFGTVCVESLNVRGMVRSDKLARHIQDAGWSGFLNVLKHKAESAGVRVIEVGPRNTSRTCSVCGHCEEGNRPTQSAFRCLRCGHEANADVNAARNILARGCPELAATNSTARTGPTGVKPGVTPACPRSPSLTPKTLRAATDPTPKKRKRKPSPSRAGVQLTLWPDDT
jgi:putative transposase